MAQYFPQEKEDEIVMKMHFCVILLILCAMKYLASVHKPKQSDVN